MQMFKKQMKHQMKVTQMHNFVIKITNTSRI